VPTHDMRAFADMPGGRRRPRHVVPQRDQSPFLRRTTLVFVPGHGILEETPARTSTATSDSVASRVRCGIMLCQSPLWVHRGVALSVAVDHVPSPPGLLARIPPASAELVAIHVEQRTAPVSRQPLVSRYQRLGPRTPRSIKNSFGSKGLSHLSGRELAASSCVGHNVPTIVGH
jgi:hypothetical protein